jgi:curved DNA-binding protein CbpA
MGIVEQIWGDGSGRFEDDILSSDPRPMSAVVVNSRYMTKNRTGIIEALRDHVTNIRSQNETIMNKFYEMDRIIDVCLRRIYDTVGGSYIYNMVAVYLINLFNNNAMYESWKVSDDKSKGDLEGIKQDLQTFEYIGKCLNTISRNLYMMDVEIRFAEIYEYLISNNKKTLDDVFKHFGLYEYEFIQSTERFGTWFDSSARNKLNLRGDYWSKYYGERSKEKLLTILENNEDAKIELKSPININDYSLLEGFKAHLKEKIPGADGSSPLNVRYLPTLQTVMVDWRRIGDLTNLSNFAPIFANIVNIISTLKFPVESENFEGEFRYGDTDLVTRIYNKYTSDDVDDLTVFQARFSYIHTVQTSIDEINTIRQKYDTKFRQNIIPEAYTSLNKIINEFYNPIIESILSDMYMYFDTFDEIEYYLAIPNIEDVKVRICTFLSGVDSLFDLIINAKNVPEFTRLDVNGITEFDPYAMASEPLAYFIREGSSRDEEEVLKKAIEMNNVAEQVLIISLNRIRIIKGVKPFVVNYPDDVKSMFGRLLKINDLEWEKHLSDLQIRLNGYQPPTVEQMPSPPPPPIPESDDDFLFEPMTDDDTPVLVLYEVLELTPQATEQDIKTAYRKLAKKYHPDKSSQDSVERFKSIQNAYDVLSVPGRKEEYDRTGNYDSSPPSPQPSPPSPQPEPPSPFMSTVRERNLLDFGLGVPLSPTVYII